MALLWKLFNHAFGGVSLLDYDACHRMNQKRDSSISTYCTWMDLSSEIVLPVVCDFSTLRKVKMRLDESLGGW